MDLFDSDNLQEYEQYIQAKTKALGLPFGGSIELLPLCNMDCKMCYIHMTQKEMEQEGSLLDVEEWLEIAVQLKEEGVLNLLLTGGEPLLYPGFQKLYIALQKMGFILTVNTNGTLISDTWADFFSAHPPRRINISLYGPDEATYEELCGRSDSFMKVIRAVELLRERQITMRFSLNMLPQNYTKFSEMVAIANRYAVPIAPNFYMFPPVRKADREKFVRLSPEEAAKSLFDYTFWKTSSIPASNIAKAVLDSLKQPVQNAAAGYSCSAGHNGFWLTWKGELLSCGMLPDTAIDMKSVAFKKGWEIIKAKTRAQDICVTCENCRMRNLCHTCPAACFTETGRIDGVPEYLCRRTKEYIRLLCELVPEEEQAEYTDILML